MSLDTETDLNLKHARPHAISSSDDPSSKAPPQMESAQTGLDFSRYPHMQKNLSLHLPKHKAMLSKYMSKRQIKGLIKTGDSIIPGDGKNFPAFSETDFHYEIDRMLDFMTEDDRQGALMLLGIFSFLPKFLITALLLFTEKSHLFPNIVAAPLRMINIGIRGMIFTLYYSKIDDQKGQGQKIMDAMNYHTTIVRRDLNATSGSQDVLDYGLYIAPSSDNMKEIYARAHQSEKGLSKMPLNMRLKYIEALKTVILNKRGAIIDRIQLETQKSRSDALFSEIFGVLDHLQFLCQKAPKALGDAKVKTPIVLMGKKSRVVFGPVGTVLVISPWNYPFYQAIVPITTSFVAGNATLYKPSEFTPLQGLVEEILLEAGFERDWIQVIYGDGNTGAQLIKHRPDKIFFTGSVATGKRIMAAAAEHIIPVELELGGKDPMIVFEDANLERATSGALWGAMTNTGQSCTSVERLYIQESIYEDFKKILLEKARDIKQVVDDNGDSDIGQMTTTAQVEIVSKHLEDAKSKGAKILCGMEWDRKSVKIPPIILENVSEEMLVAREETFGPILPLFKFDDESEAVSLANDSEYGLSASVWSKDMKRTERVARALVTGNVSINNVMLTEGNHHLPFGGTKLSGIGRYKGVWGLQNFSNLKSVISESMSSKIEANWYPYTDEKYGIFDALTETLFKGGLLGFIKFAVLGMKLENYSNKAGKKGRNRSR